MSACLCLFHTIIVYNYPNTFVIKLATHSLWLTLLTKCLRPSSNNPRYEIYIFVNFHSRRAAGGSAPM